MNAWSGVEPGDPLRAQGLPLHASTHARSLVESGLSHPRSPWVELRLDVAGTRVMNEGIIANLSSLGRRPSGRLRPIDESGWVCGHNPSVRVSWM